MRWLHNKKVIFSAAVILLVVVVAVILAFTLNVHKPKTQSVPIAVKPLSVCTTKANEPLLLQAAGAIYSYNLKTLGQAVQKIEQLPNYQSDPNCLYPVLKYYIDTYNHGEASFYLKKIEPLYKSGKSLSGALVSPESLASLQTEVKASQSKPMPKVTTFGSHK